MERRHDSIAQVNNVLEHPPFFHVTPIEMGVCIFTGDLSGVPTPGRRDIDQLTQGHTLGHTFSQS